MLNEIYGYTFQTVLKSSAALGFAAGMLGVLITAGKTSRLPGSASGAALIGMLLSAALTPKANWPLTLVWAAAACMLSFLLTKFTAEVTKIGGTTMRSFAVSVNFGVCITIIAFLSKNGNAAMADMNKFILGEAATMLKSEADTVFCVCTASAVITAACVKRFKAVLFSRELARTTMIPTGLYKALILIMTTAVTVTGIQIMGILLMGAIFVIPAAAAMMWTRSFAPAVFLSGFIGGVAGAAGGVASGYMRSISTGPAVITFAALLFFISAFLAPQKGLLWKKRRKYACAQAEGETD